MTRTSSPVRFEWSDRTGPARLRRDLERLGIAWFRMPSARTQVARPRELVSRLLGDGRSLVRMDATTIMARKGGTAYVNTRIPARFHTDMTESLAPLLQVMVCMRQARTGGESTFVDSWSILSKIRAARPALFRALLCEIRPHRFSTGTLFRPTVGWRYDHLEVTHPAQPHERDRTGVEFQAWVDREPPIEFRAEGGDVVVANNHRMLHGRRGFSGQRRFERLLLWSSLSLPVPDDLARPARRVAARVRRECARFDPTVRDELAPGDSAGAGLRRLAIAMDYIAGEPAASVARRHGVSIELVRHWAETVVASSCRALSDPPPLPARSAQLADAWSRMPSANLHVRSWA